ncbi:alpha/beta fold hydrolase [Heliobacterium gestii]|uniref:Alpha/beta fold hydrolase n=1 Tax=Heliomicrobium gestii TaxID=2699 RepID=A0A845LCT4_HELGE|nr:alpha/beta hydrolase [Heliomicrobium gestii]MBM7866476.1 pimeloyl-ACP methyl ester carboxylesterase [Heliomicrobium gestii]MZP42740.1 alpha/beta fold hydrolase [Heliomicrobium gestii]
MPVQQLNGTTIYYEVHGQGDPIVFIPGIAVSHGMWAPQVETFARTNRVILYDVRGTGRSGSMAWSTRLADHARDLASLLRFLQIDRAVICGVSFGGVIAQRFALDFPYSCRALVLVDTFSELDPRDGEEAALILMTWLASPLFLLPKGWLMPMVLNMYQSWPFAQQHLRGEVPKIRGLDAVKTRWMIRGVKLTGELGRIQCPCLGIVGAESELAIRLMERVIGAIAGATLEQVPHAFDPTSLTGREDFDRRLSRFLLSLVEAEKGGGSFGTACDDLVGPTIRFRPRQTRRRAR